MASIIFSLALADMKRRRAKQLKKLIRRAKTQKPITEIALCDMLINIRSKNSSYNNRIIYATIRRSYGYEGFGQIAKKSLHQEFGTERCSTPIFRRLRFGNKTYWSCLEKRYVSDDPDLIDLPF